MRALFSLDLVLIAPLALAILATAPWFAPVRRAFAMRRGIVRLAPGEVVIAQIIPDRGVMTCLGLLLAVALAGMAALLRALAPDAAVLALAVPAAMGFAWLWLETGNRWLLTDRRIVAASGAELPLAAVRRIAVAPGMVALHGPGDRRMRLVGVAGVVAAARLIQLAAQPPPDRQ
ncbi:MAG: hypothetical protein Kow0013_29120 [Pararhodobacter sp.]